MGYTFAHRGQLLHLLNQRHGWTRELDGNLPVVTHSVHKFLLIGLLLAGGCSGSGSTVARSTNHFPEQTGFVHRQVNVDGETKSVWVFVPPSYNPNTMYPAILFLHGLFEQGDGNTNVLAAGLGPVIARNPDRWPFITIFPQSNGSWRGSERDRLAMAALKDAEQHYMIDPDRVMLAGLSYGGLGVWEIGAQHPDKFAALVPVSGHSATELAEVLKGLPVWAFASKGDPFVGADNSAEMVKLLDSGNGRVQLTQFDGGEHDCWGQAVDQSGLLNWMLTQRRNPLRASVVKGPNGASKYQVNGKLRAWNDP